jgi:hypothetical protein
MMKMFYGGKIQEINVYFHEKYLNGKMHMKEDLDNSLSKDLQK